MGGELFPSSFSTFRDPAGSVQVRAEGVFRSIKGSYAAEILDFLEAPLATKLTAGGQLVSSEVVRRDGESVLLRHPRISFASYAWEWPPSLWLAAAELTLDLCAQLIEEGWVLKDATPLNVLFDGARPVFVDVASVEKIDPARAMWMAYGQFVRTFLLPMVAYSQLGWPLQGTQMRRDGFEPEEIYAALPWSRRLKRTSLTPVTLPILLTRVMAKVSSKPAGSAGSGVARKVSDPEITKKIMLRQLESLRAAMRRAVPATKTSVWSDYAETAQHYSTGDHDEKRQFVTQALERCEPEFVLDVGCNSGVYSRIAADTGARVVSIDTDMQALERICAELKGSKRKILPLCVDLAYPSPALGWENGETLSFLKRSEGHFDTVMMLAVIHHLLLGSQIPMAHIAALCSRITRRNLIIEWVPPTDPKFIEVLRGREAIYGHITEELFRASFKEHFSIVEEKRLENGRILFHMAR
jgi:2-polyprenyl-3-methyl-5-hydroxy-6-metoxy-1,4-benzoquinol methylase